MNCSEIREKIRDGEWETDTVKGHVFSCPACEKAAESERRLSGLIRSIPEVEAPHGFESLVLGRIGSRREASFAGSLLRLRILVPAAAALVIAVLAIAFSGVFVGDGLPDRAEVPVEPAPAQNGVGEQPPDAAVPSVPAGGNEQVASAPEVAANAQEKTRAPAASSTKDQKGGGSSTDLAARPAETIDPPWVDRNPSELPDPRGNALSISPGEVLSMFGINALREAAGWRVTEVRRNSIGAGAGVKIGDLVIELDGTPLGDGPLRGDAVKGKKLTLMRGGQRVTVSLTP